ncbi:hypothetical protein LguiA_033830 [Lonicera macranthoides]
MVIQLSVTLDLSILQLQVAMIIKGLFRRYERWNPVHPTSGAFWGMGIGIGCGVGWGPGFGPEVIGYVGAGCGVGFSVGITLAGFGIGLPANFVTEVPYSVVMGTRSGALEIARSKAVLDVRNVMGIGWTNIGLHSSEFKRKASERLSSFKQEHSLDKGIDLSSMKSIMSLPARSVLENLGKFQNQLFDPRKGPDD